MKGSKNSVPNLSSQEESKVGSWLGDIVGLLLFDGNMLGVSEGLVETLGAVVVGFRVGTVVGSGVGLNVGFRVGEENGVFVGEYEGDCAEF